MSKEYIRVNVTKRFLAFSTATGIPITKHYDNHKALTLDGEPLPLPPNGITAELTIIYTSNKVVSIGTDPCTRRVGVISVALADSIGAGSQRLTAISDELEEWFGLWTSAKMWTNSANTVYNTDKQRVRYLATVLIPFTYDN